MSASIMALSAASPPTEGEAARLRTLARNLHRVEAGVEIRPPRGGRALIASGWACELRILPDGRRQIFGFLIPGDVIDLPHVIGPCVPVALTRVEIADPTALLKEEQADGRTGLARAVKAALIRRRNRVFDHIVRLGRLSAYERVIHLLLELQERLSDVGMTRGDSFRLPLTQENMADALGLSIVHVNRTLQQLRKEGLIDLKSGSVTLLKPRRLQEICAYERAERDPADIRAPLAARALAPTA